MRYKSDSRRYHMTNMDVVPKFYSIEPTSKGVLDTGVTYNQEGATYNTLGTAYGGIYGTDSKGPKFTSIDNSIPVFEGR